MKLKIVHRIVIIGLVPLLAFLGAIAVNLSGQYSEFAIIQEMGGNVGLFEASTALVGHLQRERGKTAVFLPAAAPWRMSAPCARRPTPHCSSSRKRWGVPPCRPRKRPKARRRRSFEADARTLQPTGCRAAGKGDRGFHRVDQDPPRPRRRGGERAHHEGVRENFKQPHDSGSGEGERRAAARQRLEPARGEQAPVGRSVRSGIEAQVRGGRQPHIAGPGVE